MQTVWVLIIGLGSTIFQGTPIENTQGYDQWFVFKSSTALVQYLEDHGNYNKKSIQIFQSTEYRISTESIKIELKK